MMSVCDLKPGQYGVITAISAQGAIRKRLLDMGLLRQAKITMDRFSPFGDPLWIHVGNTQIALRRKEAETVMVDPCPAPEANQETPL